MPYTHSELVHNTVGQDNANVAQRGLLDDTVQSVHACGEDVKVTKSFTHLSRVVHNDGGSYQEVT